MWTRYLIIALERYLIIPFIGYLIGHDLIDPQNQTVVTQLSEEAIATIVMLVLYILSHLYHKTSTNDGFSFQTIIDAIAKAKESIFEKPQPVEQQQS